MPKADNDPITPTARWPSYGKPGTALPLPVIPTATPAPSRRGLLARSTAALLASAAAATVARAAPLAASAAAGEDAELIALCERLITLEAKRDAVFLTIEDDDEAECQSELLGAGNLIIPSSVWKNSSQASSVWWTARPSAGRNASCPETIPPSRST